MTPLLVQLRWSLTAMTFDLRRTFFGSAFWSSQSMSFICQSSVLGIWLQLNTTAQLIITQWVLCSLHTIFVRGSNLYVCACFSKLVHLLTNGYIQVDFSDKRVANKSTFPWSLLETTTCCAALQIQGRFFCLFVSNTINSRRWNECVRDLCMTNCFRSQGWVCLCLAGCVFSRLQTGTYLPPTVLAPCTEFKPITTPRCGKVCVVLCRKSCRHTHKPS